MFGIMAVTGYTTKTDLTKFGSIMMMGLIGIIIAMVVNIFLHSTTMEYIISFIGVLVFTGLTAYDVQKLKRIGSADIDAVQCPENEHYGGTDTLSRFHQPFPVPAQVHWGTGGNFLLTAGSSLNIFPFITNLKSLMMKAYVFPGQGAQFVGMGKDLYENSPLAKELFEKANEILGFRITDLMFSGTDEDLRQTKVTQPAIFLHSVILAATLGESFKPDMVAGHSLGEFSALVAS